MRRWIMKQSYNQYDNEPSNWEVWAGIALLVIIVFGLIARYLGYK